MANLKTHVTQGYHCLIKEDISWVIFYVAFRLSCTLWQLTKVKSLILVFNLNFSHPKYMVEYIKWWDWSGKKCLEMKSKMPGFGILCLKNWTQVTWNQKPHFEWRILKAPPVDPWAYIYRYYNIDLTEGSFKIIKYVQKSS